MLRREVSECMAQNALLSICVREFGRVSFLSAEQSAKAFSRMRWMLSEKVMEVKLLQDSNAWAETSAMPLPNCTDSSAESF